MSDLETEAIFDSELGGLIVGLIATVITIMVCLVCTIVICIVKCSVGQDGQEPSIRPEIQRSLSLRYRDEENQDDEEGGEARTRDLSQAPPPAYRNVNQYQNVDLEHTEVVRMKETYRVSAHLEPETTSLPPDYTSQRLSISVAPQELQVPEGQLPPTYSTAQLELMARRTAMEQDTIREWASLPEDNTEAQQSEFYPTPSYSQTDDISNT